MQDILLPIVQGFNSYLSDYVLIFLLLSIGIWYTIKTKFVQIRYFKEGLKNLFYNSNESKNNEHGMTSFQALTTAIAAQVGTGNIIGAAGAILTGGPGSIFWMWVIAFFGMATIYAEATIAQKTKQIYPDGTIKGGPVYYIRIAFKGKLGEIIAVFLQFP